MKTSDIPVGKLISIIYRQSQIYISKELQVFNISSSQYSFLLALYEKDGISQEELSEYLCIDKSATKRAIDLLVSGGYVYREKNMDDKRAYKLFLTQKSLDVKKDILQAIKKWEAAISSGIEQTYIDGLKDTLNLMVLNILSFEKNKEAMNDE